MMLMWPHMLKSQHEKDELFRDQARLERILIRDYVQEYFKLPLVIPKETTEKDSHDDLPDSD